MPTLAERMRPSCDHPEYLIGPAAKVWNRELEMWRTRHRFHVIFWGPPGVGKTTLCHMLSQASGLQAQSLSAVRDGVKDIRAAAEKGGLVFIDEIHRLSKSQQDVLLPILEHNEAWVLGATTESPIVTLNPAIISRLRTIYIAAPTEADVVRSLEQGLALLISETPEASSKQERLSGLIKSRLAKIAAGDVRLGLNLLESVFHAASDEDVEEILKNVPRSFTDKKHYDWASAMIKSMRGSDPDAALFYAMTALDSGEDALFLLRRCVIFASEDVGNADPQALSLAVSAYRAFECVGLPEGRIPLAQVVTYLASTVKSNKAYTAISTVREWRERATEQNANAGAPPFELTRAGAEKYRYPHDYPNAFVPFEYLPRAVSKLKETTGPAYKPSDFGVEQRLKQRLMDLWGSKNS